MESYTKVLGVTGVAVVLGAATVASASSYLLTATGTLPAGSPDGIGIGGASYTLEVKFGGSGTTSPDVYNVDPYYHAGTDYPVEEVKLTLNGATNPLNNGTFYGTTTGSVKFYSGYYYGPYGGVQFENRDSFGLDLNMPGPQQFYTTAFIPIFGGNQLTPPTDGVNVPVYEFSGHNVAEGFWIVGQALLGEPIYYSYTADTTLSVTAIPEPMSLALLAAGGLTMLRRRRVCG